MRAVQIDLDPTMVGMRYPFEVNLVGDAAATLHGPAAAAASATTTARGGRRSSDNVHRWWEVMDAGRR